ncbi:MAG: glycosyltransferase [Bacteroidota bacterium]
MKPIGFVVPAAGDIPSGGHLYNQHLIQALTQIWPGQVVSLELEAVLSLSERERNAREWLVDTLYLEQLREQGNAFPADHYGLIVHHLGSLEAGNATQQKAWHDRFEAPMMQPMAYFLCTSPYTAGYLNHLGYSTDKCLVVPPALCMTPDPVSSAAELRRVLMVANLVERKGILPFLQALQSQIAQLPFTLQIVGSAQIEPDYARQVKDWLASEPEFARAVMLSGPLKGEAVQAAYQQAQVFVSAARMETYGMALQEAVAFRLPILALDGGNVGFHMEGGEERGKLVSSDEELAIALTHLATNSALLAQWQTAAWQHRPYDSYTWAEAARRVAAFFPA